MRLTITLLVAGAAFGMAGAAYAAETTGTIKDLHIKRNMVVLSDGHTYDMTEGLRLAPFKLGEKVTVHYFTSGSLREGTTIKAAG
jgi:hypothetical protein